MKVLSCKDIGFDCKYAAIGETTAAVLRKIGEHVITYHGMMEITTEDNREWCAKIYDESMSECLRHGSE
jgi:predicted small metal-binding protein